MSKQLREMRAQAHAEGVRALAANNRSAYDKAMAEVERLRVQIEKSEGSVLAEVRGQKNDREFAFGRYLRFGLENLSAVEKRSLETRDVAEGAPMLNHLGTYSGLGYLVPTGFQSAIEQATKYFAPLMDSDVFTTITTDTGNPLPFPTSNDTAQAATIVGEASPISEVDVTASHVPLAAYKLSSGKVKASIELLQDSAFDLEAWLSDLFGQRYGRGLEGFLTNGTGSSQPTGIITDVLVSGVTPVIASGSAESSGGSETGANSIGYSDLVKLEHSVDPSYRRRAKYMFHDQTLSQLKRILDKFGRPLWVPGVANSEPDTINGYPYVINQSMPQISASANTVLFGDLKKFVVRKVKGITVQRLVELYAENGQVGFISNMRVDSRLIDAGTHPVNVLQQHS